MSEQLYRLGAADLAARFRDRTLSPVTALEALFARIDAVEPMIHAFVHLDRAGALAQARAAEEQLTHRSGADPALLPALLGVPVAVKDIVDVAGLPTTCHSALLRDNVAAADAAVTARLREAGAVILGKVATHEFAFGGPSFDLPFPPARNPWDTQRHPGGSSSGCGAGLAAGMFPLAVGTDTGGSIRHPATACGVVGLKPTFGAVPTGGVFPLAASLDHVGPMARTVTDVGMLFDAMTAPGRSGSRDTPLDPDPQQRDLAGLRVGYVAHFHRRDLPAHPNIADALDTAAQQLAAAGAEVTELELAPLQEFMNVGWTIMTSEAWSVHAPWLRTRAGDYGQRTRRNLVAGAFIGAGQYLDAQRRRAELTAQVEAALVDHDILLCASSMEPACAIDDDTAIARTYPRNARMPFNVTGHPAVVVPAGRTTDSRMPMAVQLVGRYGDEATVLRVARRHERDQPDGRWPPL